jgi:hypothetical protein
MTVRFGNLSTLMFENKVQVDLTPEDMQWIEAHRVDKADFKDDNGLHIFDLPLGIVAGANIGEELLGRLKAYNFKRHFYVETKEPEIISDPQAVASV